MCATSAYALTALTAMRVSVQDLGTDAEPVAAIQDRLQMLKHSTKFRSFHRPSSSVGSLGTISRVKSATPLTSHPKSRVVSLRQASNLISSEVPHDSSAGESFLETVRDNETRLAAEVDAKLSDLSLRRRSRVGILSGNAIEAQRREEREHKALLETEKAREEARKAAEEAHRQEMLRIEQEARKAEKERREKELKAEQARNEETRKEEKRREDQRKELERQKAELQARQKAEQEARAKAEKEAQQKSLEATSSGTDWTSVDREFEANAQRIAWIKTNVTQAVGNDPATKKAAFDFRVQLKPKLGQLTNSKAQLFKIRDSITTLLRQVQATGNKVVFQYALNLYAKFMVQQAESEANVAMQAALPLAMLTILLWSQFTELGDFVIPRFIKKCPQVIGYSCPTNTPEGRKRMGYRVSDGTWESPEQYGERIGGICAVWATMTQSKLSAAQKLKHPYPIEHSWRFLVRQLNRPSALVTNADCCAVAAWWDMSAKRFQQAYGKQADKLLDAAWNTWTASVADKKYPAAARLRLLGEDWRKSGELKTAWKVLEA